MILPTLVHEFLTISASRFPEKEALICGKERWTYQKIDAYTDRLACALHDRGLRRQDRVAVFLDNSSETVISLYGILKASGIFIILNGLMKPRKLAYVLKDSGARILITDTAKAGVVEEAIAHAGQNAKDCQIVWKGPEKDIPSALAAASMSWQEIFKGVDSDNQADKRKITQQIPKCIDVDLAALIYTSGSTGDPKGVMSTHYNMISAARSILTYLENREEDIILNVLPLSFDYGLYQVIMAFMFGGTVVLEKSFLFLHNVLTQIEKEHITGFPIVPTILAMILKLEDVQKYNLHTLRYMTNTGAALPVEHIRKLRELFPKVDIYSMFGLTECKRVSYLPPAELDSRPSSVGKAMPNCEVFILDEEGRELDPDEVGELVIRGSNVMKGYWNAPDLTAQFYRPGPFPGEMLLYSGDYFKKDNEGFLYFLGRKDDMIKSKGERISAKEIENTLHEIEGVSEAAVIGVPDEIMGQAIKAFIVKDNKKDLTDKDILKYCTNNLEIFAVPKWVVFIEKMPKSPHGKVDKKELKNL